MHIIKPVWLTHGGMLSGSIDARRDMSPQALFSSYQSLLSC